MALDSAMRGITYIMAMVFDDGENIAINDDVTNTITHHFLTPLYSSQKGTIKMIAIAVAIAIKENTQTTLLACRQI